MEDLSQLRDVSSLIDEDTVEDVNNSLYQLLDEMVSLRDLMIEFGLLAVEQGQQINRAEENTGGTVEHTKEAVQELATTVKYTRTRRELLKVLVVLGGTTIGSTAFFLGPAAGVLGVGLGGLGGWVIACDGQFLQRLTFLREKFSRRSVSEVPDLRPEED